MVVIEAQEDRTRRRRRWSTTSPRRPRRPAGPDHARRRPRLRERAARSSPRAGRRARCAGGRSKPGTHVPEAERSPRGHVGHPDDPPARRRPGERPRWTCSRGELEVGAGWWTRPTPPCTARSRPAGQGREPRTRRTPRTPPSQDRCVYKPVAGERPLWDFPDGNPRQPRWPPTPYPARRGWDVVPPTVCRDGPSGPACASCGSTPTTTWTWSRCPAAADHAGRARWRCSTRW